MGKRLFVGNVSYNTSEQDLINFFAEQGCTGGEVKIIMDRETGRSRGFAFAEFPDDAMSEKALNMNGAMIGGRELSISQAKERTGGRSVGGGGGGGGGGGYRGAGASSGGGGGQDWGGGGGGGGKEYRGGHGSDRKRGGRERRGGWGE